MANIMFKNVGISGISACVPINKKKNSELKKFFPEKDIKEIIETTGINEKRVVEKGVTASDLCYKAAEILLDDLNIDRSSIDFLIFMSQDSDYKIPATAPSLQHRLNLPTKTASFDINLSCSGYVYSLATAFALASQTGISRVLLLDGETFSKLVNQKDKVNAPIYGDAGTATLIEKGSHGESFFSLNSDGSGVDALKIDAGGARNRTSLSNINECQVEDGNIRSPHQLYMDGMEIFNFTMMNVPKNVEQILGFSSYKKEDIDLLILHQANKFMTDFFVKKLKFPKEKVPYSIDRFGNTSSASIPLTIVTETEKRQRDKVILCGFGAGLSWGSSLLSLKNCFISQLSEI